MGRSAFRGAAICRIQATSGLLNWLNCGIMDSSVIESRSTEKGGKEEQYPIKLYYKDALITRHHKPKPMSGTKVSPYNHVSGSLQSR